ncbi:MAG: hypothetical protein ACI4OO_08220 [Otoolea sp.]|nr:rhomboid family intramembrane serine protease [Clostridiaceae bacterium]MDD6072874.1 hypothetical protein [Clostridium sp.]MDY5482586.1 hypothetical protein [Clostridium sp.]
MNFLRKLERKFGRYAIHDLMRYIIMLYLAGFLLNMVNPMFYWTTLCLDPQAILHGEVWRILTFLICPPESSVLFALIAIYVYYSLGSTLERVWGAFRFNVYILTGVLGHILAAFLIYFITGHTVYMSPYFLNQSLLLSMTATFPEMQFLLFYVIPIKAKWLGLFVGAEYVYRFLFGGLEQKIEIGVSMLNFIVFFLMTRNYNKVNPKEIHRKQTFKQEMKKAEVQKIRLTHHKCAVCGRTEKDDPNLEFRYCSKCEGGLEYCMDHLYTHRHVTAEDITEAEKERKGLENQTN